MSRWKRKVRGFRRGRRENRQAAPGLNHPDAFKAPKGGIGKRHDTTNICLVCCNRGQCEAELIIKNLGIVDRQTAKLKRRLPPSVDACELRQEGALGLIAAARRYDFSKRVPFGGYAILAIRGRMLDWLAYNMKHESARRSDVLDMNRLGAVPSYPRLVDRHCDLRRLMRVLPPNTRRVVEMTLAGLTGREIAGRLDISPTRVCQHLAEAKRLMRKELKKGD